MLIRHEVLGKCLFFIRLQPGEVRLIVRIDAGHQLDVRAVRLCQVAVPCLAEVAVSPCPLLLARGNVVVCHMQQAGIYLLIKVSDKVIIGVGCHIGGRHFDVAVAGNVDSFRIVIFVIFAGSDGEGGYRALSVVHYCMDVRREYGICMLIDRYGRIRPPEEGLRRIGTVVKASLDLDICLVRIEREGGHSFGTVHLINLADVYGG